MIANRRDKTNNVADKCIESLQGRAYENSWYYISASSETADIQQVQHH
jgi:hypothetical protein